MNRTITSRALGWMLLELAAWGSAVAGGSAAELRLRGQCVVSGPLVKLGDLAQIVATDPRQAAGLAAIELFPAPPAREQRFVGIRELQDLLLLRGVNLAEHEFSGASQVTVTAAGAAPLRPEPVVTISAATTQRADRRLCAAVVKYLEKTASDREAWSVEAELSQAQARLLADPARPIKIAGGRAPWSGPQHFEVTVQTAQGAERFGLEARVSVPTPLVLASRSLSRGTIIRETDVEMQAGAVTAGAGFHSLAEVLGREVTRAVTGGKALLPDDLRPPLSVHRGEVVTVYANTAGIRIRTTARARDEGSPGELVAVQSLLDRSTYYARVSGIREVEVFARAPRVECEEASGPQNVLRR
ncbi:MAG: flagellar basal body P-ring formation chaperone FlgA [Thermoguttaceae bacterium]